MATTTAIREGIAARLATIAELHVYPKPPGAIIAPAAVVRRRQTRYDVTFDDVDDSSFAVTMFVQFANVDVAHDQMDGYVSPAGATSVAAAIHADPTLGGVVDFVRVTSAEGERLIDYDGTPYLSVEFIIEIGD